MSALAEYRQLTGLLIACGDLRDGHPLKSQVSQLEHMLQCAGRAERAGADDELVLVALCHDAGKPLSETHHPTVIAEVMRAYVSPRAYWLLSTHGEFQADIAHGTYGTIRHVASSWYADALRLATWDAESFDPCYPNPTLSHFLPRLWVLYRL